MARQRPRPRRWLFVVIVTRSSEPGAMGREPPPVGTRSNYVYLSEVEMQY